MRVAGRWIPGPGSSCSPPPVLTAQRPWSPRETQAGCVAPPGITAPRRRLYSSTDPRGSEVLALPLGWAGGDLPCPCPCPCVHPHCPGALHPCLQPTEGSTGADREQSPAPLFPGAGGGSSLPGFCLIFIEVRSEINEKSLFGFRIRSRCGSSSAEEDESASDLSRVPEGWL